jgi:hypothetical protein
LQNPQVKWLVIKLRRNGHHGRAFSRYLEVVEAKRVGRFVPRFLS